MQQIFQGAGELMPLVTAVGAEVQAWETQKGTSALISRFLCLANTLPACWCVQTQCQNIEGGKV